MLAYVGTMLAHLGAYVEAMLAICETIPVERPPRCPFFLPGPFCGTKNHVKTTAFYFRQQKNVLQGGAAHIRPRPCRRPPRTIKNSRVLRRFLLFSIFRIFRSLWLKMGQDGPT